VTAGKIIDGSNL